jgi:hypothetical protein
MKASPTCWLGRLTVAIGLALLSVAALPAVEQSAPPAAESEATSQLVEFVELGTPRADVIRIMGQPDRATAFESIKRETLVYGESLIELHNGVVVGWRNEGNPKIWMGDPQPDAAPVEVGSLPEQVLAVMGTPKEVQYNAKDGRQNWRYGSSGIRFSGGKVIDWSNFGKLKVGNLERPESSVPMMLPVAQPQTAQSPAPTSLQSVTPQRIYSSVGGGGSGRGSGGGRVQVKGYTRKDGTYVRPHTRSR